MKTFYFRCCSLVATLVASSFFVTQTEAFASLSKRRHATELFTTTKSPPELPPIRDISYGEESRKYRRTVYSHDDWVNHRSPDRFWRNLKAIAASGVYKNIGKEVSAATGVAVFVLVWNALAGGYTDFDGVKHAALIQSQWMPILGLPLAPFTLSSPSLGLLLGTKMHATK